MSGVEADVVAKCALVVDDSKSARMFLSKMLEKYELDVVSVESAEQAIEYLAHHRPDVIFMDHLMPGMDGFQAVRTIKNNPRTATIPIMMYTSQEGELYVGQARALGAVGVLPKQIKPADVSKVLYQLHLLPDRRSGEQSTFRQLSGSVVQIDDGDTTAPVARPVTELALREQITELRRTLVSALDDHADRIRADLNAGLQASLDDTMARLTPEPPRRRVSWAGIAAALAGAIAIASLVIAAQQAAHTRMLANELAQLRETLKSFDPGASSAGPSGASAGDERDPSLSARRRRAAGATTLVPGTITVAAVNAPTANATAPAQQQPIVEVVPYGEDPLSGPRLDALRQLVDRLIAQGFHGTVDVKLFPGRFCLMGDATDGFSLAPDETPYSRCDLVGASLARDDGSSPRVPVAFADLAAELRSASHGAADVQVLAGDDKATLVAYPPVSDALTAGEWNHAAAANNRIEIRLR